MPVVISYSKSAQAYWTGTHATNSVLNDLSILANIAIGVYSFMYLKFSSCQTQTLIVLLCIICMTSHAFADVDKNFTVTLIAADTKSGFNFPYVLRTPINARPKERSYLIVESNNFGPDDNFSNQIEAALTLASGSGVGPNIATKLDVPLLIPVFPRTQEEHLVYTHALDRDTLLIENDPRERLDLQLLKMVEDAQKRLVLQKVSVDSKFVLVGFSASGTFSNRFAVLHPDRLLAVVSGAVNAFPMLPISTLHGRELNYPLGISDIENVTGQKFKKSDWIALPQMIFMGANDDNDATQFPDAYSDLERNIIHQCLGEEMDKRWQESQEIILRLQPNVSFTTYGQVGHWTDGRINGDIVNFVRITMLRASIRNET